MLANIVALQDNTFTNNTNHQLSYNATKSFSLCFKPYRIKIKPPDFALGEKVIPSVDQCKYLGIIISVKNCDAD